MVYTHRRHRHGNIRVGRVMVAAGCLIVAAANGWISWQASRPPDPGKALEILMLITLPWIFAGAWGMVTRQNWGRVMMLAILYVGSLAFFLETMTMLTLNSGAPQSSHIRPMIVGLAAYLIVSLFLTHSKHVRRLTSRALE